MHLKFENSHILNSDLNIGESVTKCKCEAAAAATHTTAQ